MSSVAATGPSPRRGLSPAAFTRALFDATTFTSIVAAVDGLSRVRTPGLQRIALFWSTRTHVATAQQLRCAPRSARSWVDSTKALQALHAGKPQQSPSSAGLHMRCWPLRVHDSGVAILQVEGTPDDIAAIEADPTLSEGLELLSRRVAGTLEAQQLRTSV